MKPARHLINCGGGDAGAFSTGRTVHKLSLYGALKNVTVNVDGLSMTLSTKLSPALIDLIEIATYVYAADRLIPRGAKKQTDMGVSWVRDLRFQIPVREHSLWSDIATQRLLETTLSFLSGDDYYFQFVRSDALPESPAGLFSGDDEPSGIEDVILFSGGLDSTAGAVQRAVVGKRRVALVHHQSITKFKKRIDNLVTALGASCEHQPLLLRIEASFKRGLKAVESTQRSRSFLYMTMGLAVARALDLRSLNFFENGPLSLNVPLAENILGSRATRSTHPRVLRGFEGIAKAVANERIAVDNPFLLKTKTDVVRSFHDAGVQQLIGLTRSCALTAKATNKHPHCGTCSQCIDRRFAVLAAKATDHEDVSQYKVDPTLGPLSSEAERTTAISYISTARRLDKISVEGVAVEYPTVLDAGPYIGGDVDEGLLKIANLLKRHASQVLMGLKLAIEGSSEAYARGEISDDSLLALVGPRSGGGGGREDDEPANYFRKKGSVWKVRFQGSEPFWIPDRKGFRELQLLLAKAGSVVDALDLYNMGVPEEKQLLSSGAEPDIDEESLNATNETIRDMDCRLEKAIANNDNAAQARIRKERGEVIAHLRKHTDKEGRIRMLDKAVEKARSTVSHRIDRVLKQIREKCPELADHLRHPNLSRGAQFCYSPGAPAPSWST